MLNEKQLKIIDLRNKLNLIYEKNQSLPESSRVKNIYRTQEYRSLSEELLKLSETTNPKNEKWITVYPNKQNCEDQEQILELLKDETLLFVRNLFKLAGCSFEENKDIFDFIFEARNKYDLYTTKAVDVLTEQQLQNLVKYINYYPKNS